jgi:hypothetical protein
MWLSAPHSSGFHRFSGRNSTFHNTRRVVALFVSKHEEMSKAIDMCYVGTETEGIAIFSLLLMTNAGLIKGVPKEKRAFSPFEIIDYLLFL